MKNTEQNPWHTAFDAEITFPRGEAERIIRSVQNHTGTAITIIFERETPDGVVYLTDPSRPITSSVALILGTLDAQVKKALPEQMARLRREIAQLDSAFILNDPFAQ